MQLSLARFRGANTVLICQQKNKFYTNEEFLEAYTPDIKSVILLDVEIYSPISLHCGTKAVCLIS